MKHWTSCPSLWKSTANGRFIPGCCRPQTKLLNAEPVPEAAGNFHITDDHLGEGGAKQKYARNIAAIRTLFQLEQEHRGATAEEQEMLSQYVGWGGLPDAFDPDKGNWAKEYRTERGCSPRTNMPLPVVLSERPLHQPTR